MTTITRTRTEYDALIQFLKISKLSFSTKQGKHSMNIKADKFSINFISSMRSDKFFSATRKVESDLTGIQIPDVDEEKLEYFTHDIREDKREKKVYTLDISSAYATALLNRGMLSKKTYNYILRLSKPERLACIGMLAKESVVTIYNKGVAVDTEIQKNEKRPFFFLAVDEISYIMRCIKMEAGSDYLMTWVDCVYLTNNRKLKNITSMLDSWGYNSKAGIITNLSCDILYNKVSVTYEKNGVNTGFYIPHLHIINSNISNNEKAIQDFAHSSGIRSILSKGLVC